MELLEDFTCTLNSLVLFFPLFNLHFCLIKINVLKYRSVNNALQYILL